MQVSGLISGIDWEDLVDQLMQLEARPINLLRQQKSKLEQAQGTWLQASSLLSSLRAAANGLKDAKLFEQYRVESSHSERITASIRGHVMPGIYEIVVEQLAQAHSIALRTAQLQNSGKIAISGHGAGAAEDFIVEVEVTAGDSAMDLAAKINSAMEIRLAQLKSEKPELAKEFVPVRAQVIDDTLVLTRGSTGETGIYIEVIRDEGSLSSELGPEAWEELRPAQPAKVLINGLEVKSQSNTITAVPGLSFDILQAGADVTIKLTVSHDRKAVEGKINSFITAYNNLLGQLVKWTDKGGVLQGDALARGAINSLRRMLSTSYPAGDGGLPLISIGIGTTGQSHTISFDPDRFWRAYEDDPEKVLAALQGAADELDKYISTFLGSNGLLSSLDKSYSTQVRSIDANIERMQQRLEMRRQTMINRFIQLEQLMSQMMTQSNWLAMQTQSLNLNWRGAGGQGRR